MANCILQKNNKTGEILVKRYVSNGCHVMLGYRSSILDEVKAYQRFYDNVFGKDNYSFFYGDDSQVKKGE